MILLATESIVLAEKIKMHLINVLLLLAGDVERNPGPPKAKGGPPTGKPKEPSKEEVMASLKDKDSAYFKIFLDFQQ